MIEMETLSPLKELEPGECIDFSENWSLMKSEIVPNWHASEEVAAFMNSIRPQKGANTRKGAA